MAKTYRFRYWKLSYDERNVIDETVSKAAEAVISYIEDGVDIAMNRYNTATKKKEKTNRN